MSYVREDMNIETAKKDSVEQDKKALKPLDSGLSCVAASSRGGRIDEDVVK